MKELKIEAPKGYVIDQENSDLANGVVKFKKKKSRIPKSVDEINGRSWYISNVSSTVIQTIEGVLHPDVMSTKERAEAFLALMQLREIHAAIEQKEDASAVSTQVLSNDKNMFMRFWFETIELCHEFQELHADLIEKVKGI